MFKVKYVLAVFLRQSAKIVTKRINIRSGVVTKSIDLHNALGKITGYEI
jgi:hypothetical protein